MAILRQGSAAATWAAVQAQRAKIALDDATRGARDGDNARVPFKFYSPVDARVAGGGERKQSSHAKLMAEMRRLSSTNKAQGAKIMAQAAKIKKMAAENLELKETLAAALTASSSGH